MSSEQLFYEIIITDKFGKVIAREHHESRSYLKVFNQSILGGMSAVAQSIKLIDGSIQDSDIGYYNLYIHPVGGIVVGSGNTAVDISDYKLETQITDGTGVGQLSKQVETVASPPTVTATESGFTIRRIFVNYSGGDVTVWELGIYARCSTTEPKHACIIRDVLGGASVIPDGGAISVTYTIKAVE